MYKSILNVYNDKENEFIQEEEIIENYIDIPNNEMFIKLYDNNKNELNVILVCRPFEKDLDYKIFLTNKHDHIFLGISSFQEFPKQPLNKHEGWKTQEKPSGDQYYEDMYKTIFDGWLHCFKKPEEYFDTSKPHTLISESDFVDYNSKVPSIDLNIKNPGEDTCYDWTSINKNWPLAKKCLPILSGPKEKGGFNLKGLLVGREGCDLPEDTQDNLTTTLHMNYGDLMKSFDNAKFIFIPNIHDASPRIITEAMSHDTRVLINKNIVGGWKYADSTNPLSIPPAGELFSDEKDLSVSLEKLLKNMDNYAPRKQIIDNYGPINSGKRLKKFLYDNFKDKLKYKYKLSINLHIIFNFFNLNYKNTYRKC